VFPPLERKKGDFVEGESKVNGNEYQTKRTQNSKHCNFLSFLFSNFFLLPSLTFRSEFDATISCMIGIIFLVIVACAYTNNPIISNSVFLLICFLGLYTFNCWEILSNIQSLYVNM
jgi:hypothetical protein